MRRHGWLGILILVLGACGAPPASSSPGPASAIATASASAAVVDTSADPTAASPAIATASPPPAILDGESWLTFQTQTAAGYGVHFVRPDGTGLHKWAAPVPGTHEHPDWSPDGSRILLNAVMPDGTEDLWVGNIDGSDTRMLLDCVAPCVWVDEAAWSPDGTQVAFQRLVDEGGRFTSTLELLDVATGATSVVLTMPAQEVVLQPRWSPDGTSIVVEALHLVANDVDADVDLGSIGVVDLDDPAAGVIRIAEDFANSPDWSPDGSRVLWSRPGATGGSDVWVSAPDGSDARRVTDLAAAGGGADQPAFTPDGQSIVFVWSDPAKPGRVGQVDLDGSDLGSAIGDLTLDSMHPRIRPLPAS